MKIRCPHCSNTMRVKAPRAGTFKPSCRGCGKRFLLKVDERGEATTSMVAGQPPAADSQPAAAQASAAVEDRPPAADETLPQAAPAKREAGPDETAAESAAAAEEGRPQPPASSPAPDQTSPQTAYPAPPPDETLAQSQPPPAGVTAGLDETLPQGGPSSSSGIDVTQPQPTEREATAAAGGDATMAAEGRGGQTSHAMPQRLGGYRLLRELGRGAMGAVYVARQVALARDVALKVIQEQWAASPRMLARFMREAFAAAQISHHNVVQIYDLGTEGRTNYFSMELVHGCNLAELVERRGHLPPAEAAGLILQAARGLQCAHNEGLVHRDVKPANLLLSEHGVVKVADLGLVKIASVADEAPDADDDGALPDSARGDLTLAHNAMGTAAFMAPEQGQDASSVDHRADIYSLGCTLYVLLTGRPPFEGETAVEVITKHQSNPVVRPEAIIDGIPHQLSEIVLRMVAKDPAQRQASIGEVISQLDGVLSESPGAGEPGRRTPDPEELKPLAEVAARHAAAPAARRRSGAAFGAAAGGLLLAVVAAFINTPAAVCLLAAVATAAVTRQLVANRGFGEGAFGKLRELASTATLSDIFTWSAAGLLLLAALWVLGLAAAGATAVILGAAAGAGFAAALDRAAQRQLQPLIEQARQAVQRLRMKGYDEDVVRQAAAERAGPALLEELFGYQAARQLRSGTRLSIRDALYDALDARVRRKRQQQQQSQLQAVEQQRLQSEGVPADEARERAEQIAAALADEVRQLKQEAQQRRQQQDDPAEVARQKRERMKKLLAEAREPQTSGRRLRRLARFGLNQVAGARTRFLAGVALLAACLLWIRQNELVDSLRTLGGLSQLLLSAGEQTEPWRFPIVGPWVNSLHVGLAGLALLFTAQYSGWRSSLTALPGAALIAFGPALGVPDLGLPGGAAGISTAAGLALVAAGVRLFGDDEA